MLHWAMLTRVLRVHKSECTGSTSVIILCCDWHGLFDLDELELAMMVEYEQLLTTLHGKQTKPQSACP